MQFTQAQKRAIHHKDGALLIVAGPGSGKTAVLTHRIVCLIEEGKVPPEQILVITFTRAAAKEMESRFLSIMPDPEAGKKVTVRTFHALFYSMLRENGQQAELLEEKQALSWMTGWVQEQKRCGYEEGAWVAERLLTLHSRMRNTGIRDTEGMEEAFVRAAERFYTDKKEEEGRIDFDDMMDRLARLFTCRPDVLERYRNRYRYMMVDEYQDTNGLQARLLGMLAEKYGNLCVVGDDDQSIYRFRGAVPGVLLLFPKTYPDAVRVDLDINFRCGDAIVAASSHLIAHNRERFNKRFHTPTFKRSSVEMESHVTSAAQAAWIARLVSRELEHTAPEEIAILVRTRKEAAPIKRALRIQNIAYESEEEDPRFSEVRIDIRAYFRWALDPDDAEALQRIWSRPKRGIPTAFRSPHSRNPEAGIRLDEMEYHRRRILKLAPREAIRYIGEDVGYLRYLKDLAEKEQVRWSDMKEAFDTLCWEAGSSESLSSWLDTEPEDRAGRIAVRTMHGAKGLEYDVVILPNLNEGVCPHERAQTEAEVEEERRIFYVAMTRARKKLWLSYVRPVSSRRKPSRFLQEL